MAQRIAGGVVENGIIVFKLPEEYPACMNSALRPPESCEHGLSAWLCEDPINHYPSDRRY